MAIQKAPVNISFAAGLDLKTDEKQVQPGKFLVLENSVFTKGGRLTKRNGNQKLTALPDSSSTYATIFNGNLTAIGTSFQAYSKGSETWVNKGSIQPIELETLPLIRSNTNQSQCDTAIAANGLCCLVFTDNPPVGGVATPTYKYAVIDSTTGQNIVAPTVIPVASGTVTGSPRVFLLRNYFVIVFTNVIAATNHLQYVTININNPTIVGANTDISTTYTPSTTVNFDGVVSNNTLYLAWNGSDGGGAIRMATLSATLVVSSAKVFAGRVATLMSICADESSGTPVIYVAFYTTAGTTGYILAVNQSLVTILSPTQWIAAGTILNVTVAATAGVATILYEVSNAYSYDGAIKSNFINKRTCTLAGSLGTATVVIRSVGLASKAFLDGTTIYFLAIYGSTFQPTYFLINTSGNIVAKLAYSNGPGYYTLGLPSVTLTNSVAQIGYFFKDLIIPVNKTQGVSSIAGVYSQTGINLATFTIGTSSISSAEIGQDLHLTGGFMWMYDGYAPVEHGFHVWPDSVEVTTSAAGGLITAQAYYYVATYEWTDNQGNVHRSAPSIPITITTTGATSTNTINVPTLRLTYKTQNPVKIVVYRWSTAQQTYYQVTSLSIPTLNSLTVDSVAITDTLADSSIIGNSILYTTGGVIENIGAPACSSITLYKSRLFLIDAEDRNLLWYSKQVIEATPVEMSDLFTIYIAPTAGAQGSTGPMTCLSALDDKLIIFKRDAIYYITGNGPDNTGANNDFSEPVFITSTVGCTNQKSIVSTPNGLMFQSDKGIWILGRNLVTQYIGAPVEDFNQYSVQSAKTIPGTNYVLFSLSNGITLMYDYFYGQWGTFKGMSSISSALYENLFTYINSNGEVFQENPGSYLDGAVPVNMSFTTSWFALNGLQGFERAYFFYLLGDYLSPHKLTISIAYDYDSNVQQVSTIMPDNFSGTYGSDPLYGNNTYGGNKTLEQWRVFFRQQKCESFQLTIAESFDPSYGTVAGAGLTISGLDILVGLKSSYPRLKATRSVG